jgi:bifunctional DNA-binding transcriptional regulator/antitoxin component of YhaV-PrlF toxin-antitoxin module
MDYTDGFKVVEIKFQGQSYNGFYKVTRKGVITVETRKDVPIKPYDQITIGVDEVVVQKVQVFQSRCELTCEAVATSDIKKAHKTLKKLKKAEQSTEKDTDGESV